jgi:hypothetical protein
LAPTVGIAATGFCYPGGILQLFSSTRSANFAAADSSRVASSASLLEGFVSKQWRNRISVKEKEEVLVKFRNFRQATDFASVVT